jgi:asparagine synthase (glutamine-hydrolysing)
MCGIAGIINSSLPAAERESAVGRMVARQRHRGPDDAGQVSFEGGTLGMCRLAIFDPANGRQPMATPDGRFRLVFNGAIYNHRELRAEMEGRGRAFATNCDTEVLLHAYAQWGEACLPRLRGMFAFAVWDSAERVFFAARDPFGIKPLYHARTPEGGLVFASETRAVLASGLVPREIDVAAAGDFLAWFSVPPPRTIYQGIHCLPAGHCLRVGWDQRVQVETWWRPSIHAAPRAGGRPEFLHKLRAQLEDTIRAHRLADVPVGAFLSGGLDSTSIVALMRRSGMERLRTFSVVFNEAEFSEAEPARQAAQALGTEHHEELVTGGRIARELPAILAALDQPTGDGINTYYASLAAHNGGVKVALSGLGGDEIFGGYPSFRDMPRLARWLPLWRLLPEGIRRALVAKLRGGTARRRKAADFLHYGRDLHDLCSLRRRVLSEASRAELLAPEARALAMRQGPYHPRLDDFVAELAGADDMRVVGAWEMRTYMADVLLRDSDVFSMAHSLELRVPFVDEPFTRWWWAQPADFRRTEAPKSILAEAVADLVPPETRRRAKRGFTMPFAVWMRAELRPFLEETFAPASLAQCPWLEAGAVRRLREEFFSRRDDVNWSRVWTLAMLIACATRREAA